MVSAAKPSSRRPSRLTSREQLRATARRHHAQVPVRRHRRHPPARRALQEALLDQVGLDHVLDGVAFLADRSGHVVQAHRPAVETVDHRLQQLAVHDVEAQRVDVEHGQCLLRDLVVDAARALDVGVVAHAAQQAVGDAGRAARAARDLAGAPVVDRRLQQPRAAMHDARQLLGRVELQPRDDAEAVAQRIGQHAGARGGAHQREGLQVELDAARGRALADHDVDLVVLQRRIEDFLHHRRQAMDLVDEEDVVALEVGQQRGQVLGLFQHRARGLAQVHTEFVGDDVRQRGLAQARRAEQQHVVQRLAALLRRADEDLQLLARLGLAHVLAQALGPQRALHGLFGRGDGRGGDDALGRGDEIVGLYRHARISRGRTAAALIAPAPSAPA